MQRGRLNGARARCGRGVALLLHDLSDRLADLERRARLLEDLQMVEHEPSMLGATSHLLAVATSG